MHFSVQIGEEVVVCNCGDTLRFFDRRRFLEYFWTAKEEVAKENKEAIEGDVRNLN